MIAATSPRPAKPAIREARPEDLPAIAEFLAERMGHRDGAEHFRRYFEYRWLADKPNLGFVIADGERLGGFLGTIYARRRVRGREELFCNLTSWVVEDRFRNLSLLMMARCLARPGCTFTTLSPSAKVIEVLKHFKFQRIDAEKLVFTPVSGIPALLWGRRPRISWRDAVEGRLTEAERRIFQDHRPYRCGHFLVEWGGERCYAVTVRRGRGMRAFADVLHASDPDLLADAIAWLHVPIARTHGTVLTGIDRRLLRRTRAMPGAFSYRGLRPILFRSDTLGPDDIDALYTELVPMYG